MKQMRWAALALTVGLLAGCPNGVSPGAISKISSLLGEFGLSLKTVDPSTGEEKTYAKGDISQVVDDSGKPIDYSFDADGKMVFRPTKEGEQTVTIKLKDGTSQKFQVNGKSGAAKQTGDVAFIPDASGQGFSTKIAVGGSINAKQERHNAINGMANVRIKVTFGQDKLPGLSKTNIKAVYMDRMRAPMDAVEVTDSGDLKLDPAFFFHAREYFKLNNAYPPIRVAYFNDNKLTIVVAKMTALPTLPDFTPSKPGDPPPPPIPPEKFTSGQILDLTDSMTDTAASLEAYETANQLMAGVPKVGATPPPPNAGEQQMIFDKMKQYSVLFELGQSYQGLTRASVKGVMVARMGRPAMDIMEISTSSIRLDPNLVMSMFSYYKGPLEGKNTPWVRIWFTEGTANKILKFRIKTTAVPQWFSSLTYNPPTPPNPIPPGWMPPPPPLDLLGTGHDVAFANLEVNGVETLTVTPDAYKQQLFSDPSNKNP